MSSLSRTSKASALSKFKQASIIVLTLATAFIHFFVGFPHLALFPILFYLNALGYIALLFLYYLPQFAKIHLFIRWLFIAYTLLTIILYFMLSHYPSLAGYTDKIAEVILLLLLLLDGSHYNRTKHAHA